jgi:endo-alpha-1,4-polygalactosaminidase (GH114 family)
MFNQKERAFAVVQMTEQDSSLGIVNAISFLREIKAKVFTRAGNTAVSNNVLITNSTHFALTSDKQIQANMQLISDDEDEVFIIDYVINDGAEAQLFLKKVI